LNIVNTATRIHSADAIRLIAIFAVILVHTEPFTSTSMLGTTFDLGLIVNQLARFAVPCFFVLSGYFWAKKIDGSASVLAPSCQVARRIFVILLVWSIFYLLPTNIYDALQHGLLTTVQNNVARIWMVPVTAIMEGTKTHLWFLIALLWCLAISAVMLANNMQNGLIALALVLFGTGLLGNAYADTPIGLHITFNFRNGPFFGLIFFVTGYLLQRRGPRESWLGYGLALAAMGSCLQLIEVRTLNALWGSLMNQDFTIGTYFSGVGVALIALSGTRLLSAQVFSRIGPLVLGIYAVHVAFVDLLKPLDKQFAGIVLWDCAYPLLVFFFSMLAALTLARNRYTRSIVM
jgi:surface polysaccharide O-acyltransferase-like enzyme